VERLNKEKDTEPQCLGDLFKGALIFMNEDASVGFAIVFIVCA